MWFRSFLLFPLTIFKRWSSFPVFRPQQRHYRASHQSHMFGFFVPKPIHFMPILRNASILERIFNKFWNVFRKNAVIYVEIWRGVVLYNLTVCSRLILQYCVACILNLMKSRLPYTNQQISHKRTAGAGGISWTAKASFYLDVLCAVSMRQANRWVRQSQFLAHRAQKDTFTQESFSFSPFLWYSNSM